MRAAGISFIGTGRELAEKTQDLRVIKFLCDEVVRVYFIEGDLDKALSLVKEFYSEYKKSLAIIEMDKALIN